MKKIIRIVTLIGLTFLLIGCGGSRHTCDAYADVEEVDSTYTTLL